MAQLRATLVFTTIFSADVLDAYYENFRRYGHLDQVDVIVIPDRKTPAEVYERARRMTAQGMRTNCPDIEQQEQYLSRIGLPAELIPYNSDNRRNVGYLMAFESGADFLISIDDDNYCTDEQDVFAEHAVVAARPATCAVINAAGGFYNICDQLEFERSGPVYARGFPYFARNQDAILESGITLSDVHLNAGLWTLDPDIDALTWLVCRPRVQSFTGRSVVLGTATWSPINTQNTALKRSAIPAYYFLKMGYPISGIAIDRYGDIFSGYFVQACIKHLGGGIRFGSPYAEHRRNSHNYMRDAFNEIACIAVLEDLLPWLLTVKLSGKTHLEAYAALSHEIEETVERFHGTIWTDGTRGYFHQAAWYMRAWLKACANIGSDNVVAEKAQYAGRAID